MGRPRKYTAKALRERCAAWLDSITREREVTELVDSGERDEKGHVIYEAVPVRNKLGETITETEFLVPPEVGPLCRYLGIHPSTWSAWAEDEKLGPVVSEMRERILEWNLHELITRPGKDIRGIEANLRLNYGFTEKREVELGSRAAKAISATGIPLSEREAILREIAAEFGENADDEG